MSNAQVKGNILLIDDAENWYETVAFILREEGYDVIWVSSRAKAREVMNSESHIDIAMVNLNLRPDSPVPDGTGYLMLEELQREWPQLPRIALSSFEEPRDGLAIGDKVVELYYRYKVKHVAIKGGQHFASLLVHAVNEVLLERNGKPIGVWFPITTISDAEKLASEGRLKEALEMLSNIETCKNEAILLSSQFNHTCHQERLGTITREQARTEYSRITEAILALISRRFL